MWDRIWDFGGDIIHVVGHFDRQQWIFVFVAVLVFGIVCMRGFGSRMNY